MQGQGIQTMNIRKQNRTALGVYKRLTMMLFGVGILVAGGCKSPSDSDGVVVNGIVLPTDVVLNLACENVGIHPENCVLGDPENPFITTAIIEFDPNNPLQDDKFDLLATIPEGPSGAKARFYLWATALARRASGENQWYTAKALHELYDANSNFLSVDELTRVQSLKAYKSVLDNFWGSVTFFECDLCAPDANGDLIKFPAQLNEQVGDNLFRFDSTDFLPLFDGGDIEVLEVIGKWGYTYRPATEASGFTDGKMSKNEG
jgi:hypothetical protein